MVSVINRIGMLAFLTAALLSDPLLAMEDEGGGDQRSRPRIRARRKAQPKLTDPTLIRMVGVYQKYVEESTKRVQEADAHTQRICKTITELLQRIDEASKNYASYENILQTPNYPQDLSEKCRESMGQVARGIKRDQDSISILHTQQLEYTQVSRNCLQQEQFAQTRLCFAKSIAELVSKTLRDQLSVQACMDSIIKLVSNFAKQSASSAPIPEQRKSFCKPLDFGSICIMAEYEAMFWPVYVGRLQSKVRGAPQVVNSSTDKTRGKNETPFAISSSFSQQSSGQTRELINEEVNSLSYNIARLSIETQEPQDELSEECAKAEYANEIASRIVILFRALEAKDDRLIHDALEKLLNLSSWRTVVNNTQTSAAAASSASSSSAASSSSSSAASSS